MMSDNRSRAYQGGRARKALRSALVAITCVVAFTACDGFDSLLRVETPSRIPAADLEVPGNASLIVNGVVGDFECAFGAYTVLGGLIGDELVDATQTADRMPYDRRSFLPSDGRYSRDGCVRLGVYTPLQTARASADNALGLLGRWTDAEVPNRTSLMATAGTMSGYSLVLLGEGFCSSVVSGLNENREPVYGTEISRDSVFRVAVSRFTDALAAAQASGNTAMLHTARLGRARAHLNLGQYEQARADAALVPDGFVQNATASDVSSRRRNRVWGESSTTASAVSVGEPYRSMNDPRVPVHNTNTTSVTGVPIWRQLKYTNPGSPIPLATSDEAKLIIAEADARVGGAAGLANAISIINDFRAAAGQPAFTATTQQEVLDEIVEQRRRELFLESHHLGDLIRYDLPLNPAPGTPYHGGGTYGDRRCLPLPDVERVNNPNIP